MSTTEGKAMERYAGYIRVSRVQGREGESFISPEVQRESIERWAKANGAEVSELVEELDVSGGKGASERKLGQLIEKCQRGELSGIIVWKLSRFGRKLSDVLENVERLTEAGARLVAVEDGIDTSAKGAKLLLGIFGILAEIERDARTEGWSSAVENAIERGVHVGVAPIGYVKKEDGRLELTSDRELRQAVYAIFRRRAEGATWAEIANEFEDATGIRKGHTTFANLVKSRTYRGEVYSGEFVKADAHKALVSESEWQAAQDVGKNAARNGKVKGAGILSGLITCQSCGKVLARSSDGKGIVSYKCLTNKKGGHCEHPATASVRKVDGYVEPIILKALEAPDYSDNRKNLGEAEEALKAAQEEMRAFLSHASAADLGEFYAEEVAKRREAIREAQALNDKVQLENIFALPTPDSWSELDIERKRDVASQLIEKVSLKRAGQSVPMNKRVSVTLSSSE